MAVTTAATFRDESGDDRLFGSIGAPGATATNVLTADGAGATTWSPPGGGSQPTTREQLFGVDVTIANGASAKLTWDTKTGGSDLLNLTDPANPTIVTTGVYAVAVDVQPDAGLTVAGAFKLVLELDAANEDAALTVSSPAATAAQLQPFVGATLIYYVPAGGVLNATVTNFDGAASQPFYIAQATIQRLS